MLLNTGLVMKSVSVFNSGLIFIGAVFVGVFPLIGGVVLVRGLLLYGGQRTANCALDRLLRCHIAVVNRADIRGCGG